MAEYIDRKAVLKHKRKMSGADWGGEFWDEAVLCEDICNIPAADVVEVVRCRECEYWQDNNGGYPHPECSWRKDETPDADDFCSYGERKGDCNNCNNHSNERKGGNGE